jgi:lipoate-protein ligase A
MDSSINFNSLSNKIINSFFQNYQKDCKIEYLNENSYQNNEKISKELKLEYDLLCSKEWIYGEKTPEFKHQIENRFEWGIMDVNINSKNGKIHDIVIYSDSLFPDLILEISKNLKGKNYSFEGVKEALNETKEKFKENESQINEFEKWLLNSL